MSSALQKCLDMTCIELLLVFPIKQGRTNVRLRLSVVCGLGSMRTDGTDSLLPVRRMPMGLMEYAVNFFVSEEMNRCLREQERAEQERAGPIIIPIVPIAMLTV